MSSKKPFIQHIHCSMHLGVQFPVSVSYFDGGCSHRVYLSQQLPEHGLPSLRVVQRYVSPTGLSGNHFLQRAQRMKGPFSVGEDPLKARVLKGPLQLGRGAHSFGRSFKLGSSSGFGTLAHPPHGRMGDHRFSSTSSRRSGRRAVKLTEQIHGSVLLIVPVSNPGSKHIGVRPHRLKIPDRYVPSKPSWLELRIHEGLVLLRNLHHDQSAFSHIHLFAMVGGCVAFLFQTNFGPTGPHDVASTMLSCHQHQMRLT